MADATLIIHPNPPPLEQILQFWTQVVRVGIQLVTNEYQDPVYVSKSSKAATINEASTFDSGQTLSVLYL